MLLPSEILLSKAKEKREQLRKDSLLLFEAHQEEEKQHF
jgi:hypothetical protein